MKILKKFLFAFLLVAGLIIACREENLSVANSSAAQAIPEPAVNHIPDPFPPKGYVLTSSMEAAPSMAGKNYSAINNYMKDFGFEYSEHPICSGGYGGDMRKIQIRIQVCPMNDQPLS